MALLEIRGIKKTFYTREHEVSAEVTLERLELEAGVELVLDGPSGSGKTTILHMVSGLIAPDAGQILFSGQELTALGEKEQAAVRLFNIGYIFQRLNLLDELTVKENILLPLVWRRDKDVAGIKKRAGELLSYVGLGGKGSSYPRSLSIGEQQRAAVVRAMLFKPRLLLADEPTASLDAANALKVLELMRVLCQECGTALLLSTHDESVKARFERRYSLRRGAYA